MHWVFLAVLDLCCHGLSPVAESRAGPRVAVFGLPTVVASALGSAGARHVGLRGFHLQALEHRLRVAVQKRWLLCSVWILLDLLRWQEDSSPLSRQGSSCNGSLLKGWEELKVFLSSKLEVKIREHNCSRKTTTRYSSVSQTLPPPLKSIGERIRVTERGNLNTLSMWNNHAFYP